MKNAERIKLSDTIDKLLGEEVVLKKFNERIQSKIFIPDEISKGVKTTTTLHILPLCDITYEFRNKWQAKIGTFQKEKYNSAYSKSKERERKANKNGTSNIKHPNKNDPEFWTWSHAQDTYDGTCFYQNLTNFSLTKSGIDNKAIIKYINKFANKIFSYIKLDIFKKHKTLAEYSSQEISADNLSQCKNDAKNKTPYPGDEQRELKTNIDILDYSVTKKYLPIYEIEFFYNKNKYINYCDAVKGTCIAGPVPRSGYWDEIVVGIIGTIALLLLFLDGSVAVLPLTQMTSIEPNTIRLVFLISGLACVGYILYSFSKEYIKVYQRKKIKENNKVTKLNNIVTQEAQVLKEKKENFMEENKNIEKKGGAG